MNMAAGARAVNRVAPNVFFDRRKGSNDLILWPRAHPRAGGADRKAAGSVGLAWGSSRERGGRGSALPISPA
jgi:hypothetical protein